MSGEAVGDLTRCCDKCDALGCRMVRELEYANEDRARLRALLGRARGAADSERKRWHAEYDAVMRHNPNDLYEYAPVASYCTFWNELVRDIDAALGEP